MTNAHTLAQYAQEHSVRTMNGALIEIMEVSVETEITDIDHPHVEFYIDALCDDNPVEGMYSKILSLNSDGEPDYPDKDTFLNSIFDSINDEYSRLIAAENVQYRFEALFDGEDPSDFENLPISLKDIEANVPHTGFVPSNSFEAPYLERPVFDIVAPGELHCVTRIQVGTDYAGDTEFYMGIPDDVKSLDDPLPPDVQVKIIKEIFYGCLQNIRNYRPFKDFLY